jgi:hypothetical protein
VLRRQCAVAASLWALHGGATSAVQDDGESEGLSPTLRSRNGNSWAGGESWRRGSGSSRAPATVEDDRTVTVQLDTGLVFVMRRLRCGMLFVCVGNTVGQPRGQDQGRGTSSQQLQPADESRTDGPAGTGADATGVSGSSRASSQQGSMTPPHQTTHPSLVPTESPSEADSVLSGGTVGAATTGSQATTVGSAGAATAMGVQALRRLVEELARWLDDKLGPLIVPDESSGILSGGWDLR